MRRRVLLWLGVAATAAIVGHDGGGGRGAGIWRLLSRLATTQEAYLMEIQLLCFTTALFLDCPYAPFVSVLNQFFHDIWE